MIKREETSRFGWCRKGLRTKYKPRTRISRGLIDAAPWFSVLVIVFSFSMLAPHIVDRPGISLALPESSILMNPGPSVTAVVYSHRLSSTNDVSSERVFFDYDSFTVTNAAHMRQLQDLFAKLAEERPDTMLVIEADDTRVKYGTITKLCSMAATAGLHRVNLAGRPEEGR